MNVAMFLTGNVQFYPALVPAVKYWWSTPCNISITILRKHSR